ncbi:MAG: hypothetical protein WDZ35_02960 [Crocinitomicaceae bacterium]
MRTIAIIFTLSYISLGQVPSKERAKIPLKNTSWKTNISCFEDEEVVAYELSSYPSLTETRSWGYFINFTDSTFETHYSAPCGNDCFTSVSGSYTYITGNKIEVYVASISRGGFCQKKSEYPKKKYGTYEITATSKGLRLKKV